MANPNEVDRLYVTIHGDLSDIKKSLTTLESRVDATTKKTQKSLSTFGRFLRIGFAVYAVRSMTMASKSMVQFAADVEEMQDKSSAVFREHTARVRDELGKFADEVGRSAYALEGMAAQVQDTFVPLGFARGVAADLSVELTKLATDVASLQNKADTDVMRDFQSALVGNHETVRKYGIVITENRLKQELFNMGITKSINTVSQEEKVRARLNMIIAGTTDAHGNALDTVDSYVNKQRAMNAQLDKLKVVLGQEMKPAWATFNELVKDGAEKITDFLETRKKNILAEEMKEINDEIRNIDKALIKSRKIAEGGFLITDEQIENAKNNIKRLEALRKEYLQKGKDLSGKIWEGKDAETDEVDTEFQLKRKKTLDDLRHTTQTYTLERNNATQADIMAHEVAKKLGISVGELDAELLKTIEVYSESKEALDKQTEAQRNAEAQQRNFDAAIERTASTFSDNFIDKIVEGENALKAFEETAKQVAADVAKHMLKVAIVKSLASVGIGSTTGLAGGGAIQPGVPTLVGERGAELFIPHSPGVIKNNADTARIMSSGSVSVSQTINIGTDVSSTVRAEIMSALPMIQDSTRAAMRDAQMRGGR